MLAVAMALVACGGGDPVAEPVEIGPSQRDLASWASTVAADLRLAPDVDSQCVLMANVTGQFFEQSAGGVIDGGANPPAAFASAARFSLVSNEARTFCTWTIPDVDLVGGAATSMADLLDDIASHLLKPPSPPPI
jgi:hypothetical protein